MGLMSLTSRSIGALPGDRDCWFWANGGLLLNVQQINRKYPSRMQAFLFAFPRFAEARMHALKINANKDVGTHLVQPH